ncbi:MAG: type II secretion system F family protein [Gemmataceae bacterium]
MSTILLFSLVFLSVSAGLTASYYAVSSFWSRESSRIRQRIVEEFARDEEKAPRFTLFKNPEQMQLEGTAAPAEGAALPVPARQSWWRRLREEIEVAGLKVTLRQLVFIGVGLALAAGGGAFWWGGPWLGCVVAAAAPALPFAWARHYVQRRKLRLFAQLPEAFALMARVIRAGQSVPQAFQSVAETSPNPIADEFARCQRQQNLGLTPEDTYKEMAQRCAIVEMRLFVMAMVIQRQTGGNLGDVLDRLAALLRERFRLRRRVQALTAEGRLQGLTLFVLPFVLFGAMMVINRPYAELLLEQVGLLIATGVSMVMGLLWMRSIANFEP